MKRFDELKHWNDVLSHVKGNLSRMRRDLASLTGSSHILVTSALKDSIANAEESISFLEDVMSEIAKVKQRLGE